MFHNLRQKKSFRFVFISGLLTVAAIGAAMISAVAGQIGKYELASMGSKAALGLALIIVLYVVPRLAHSVRLEYLHSEFSIHMPNAGLVLCALILVVTILALSSGNNLLYLVLAVLIATMFVSWLASRLSLARTGIAMRYPDHIFAGESVPFDVTATNRKKFLPTYSITVAIEEQNQPPPAREITKIAYYPVIPAKTSARLRVERTFTRRGVFPVRGYLVSMAFPFGFIKQSRFIEAQSEIVVYPKPPPLDDFIHLLPLTLGRVESHIKGSGTDLHAIRQYLSSDHHHHIDWKATAKTTRLMVREFTRDDDWRVTVLFDTQVEKESFEKEEFPEKFERAVMLAAGLINHFVKEGAEVRLLAQGKDSGYGIGVMHCYKLLRQLAQLAPVTIEDDVREELPEMISSSLVDQEQFRILITSVSRGSVVAKLSPSTHVISFEDL